ncbi:MAG: hypothetical protein JF614_17440, partial [Acidobacteria bacterium]|nr:hypothetical protein [Acidobacteriota bacterium]
ELYEEFDSQLSATAVERETNRFGDKSGMTIAEYALHALRMKEEWMNTRSLIRVMQEMGFQSQAHNLYTNVFGTLNREVERKDVFTKKGGKWGLREWLDEEESEEMS